MYTTGTCIWIPAVVTVWRCCGTLEGRKWAMHHPQRYEKASLGICRHSQDHTQCLSQGSFCAVKPWAKISCCSPNCFCRVFATKTNQATLWVKLRIITFLKFKQNFQTLSSSWACLAGTFVVWRSWKKLISCWLDVSLFHSIPITILYKNVWLERKYTLERKPTHFFFC